jgi:transcriptional regulator with XRE-family HTH domain
MIRIHNLANLGAIIRDLRHMHLLTQRGLAADTGCAQGQISDWERGAKIPETATLAGLLKRLGYEMAFVPLDEDGPETAPAPTESDQGAEMHTRVGVDQPEGATGLSGDHGGPHSMLGDLLVTHGPYAAGDLAPEPLRRLASRHINELRDELIALRNAAGWTRPETQEA